MQKTELKFETPMMDFMSLIADCCCHLANENEKRFFRFYRITSVFVFVQGETYLRGS